jgi:Nucleotidyl transferase AbiEii toxin, Type IV TA system
MIAQRELAALRAEWILDQGVIEKDYVLGWLLVGIANNTELNRTWVFKGGTCLRKCYYETYRFSEDLDFTIVEGGPEEPQAPCPSSKRSPRGYGRNLVSNWSSTISPSNASGTGEGTPPPRDGSPIGVRTATRRCPR